MTALRQPDFSNKYYGSKPQPEVINDSELEQKIIRQSKVKQKKLAKPKAFASSNTVPQNLKLLSVVQKFSFGLAVASMSASIGLYISTVQIPKLWTQEYQHLEDLQLKERQLIAINENMKYQIAQEAGKDKELSITQPESAMFINPAKIDRRKLPEAVNNQQEIVNLKHNSLGY